MNRSFVLHLKIPHGISWYYDSYLESISTSRIMTDSIGLHDTIDRVWFLP